MEEVFIWRLLFVKNGIMKMEIILDQDHILHVDLIHPEDPDQEDEVDHKVYD